MYICGNSVENLFYVIVRISTIVLHRGAYNGELEWAKQVVGVSLRENHARERNS